MPGMGASLPTYLGHFHTHVSHDLTDLREPDERIREFHDLG